MPSETEWPVEETTGASTHIPKCDALTPYERSEKLSTVLERHAHEAYPGVYCAEPMDGDEEAGWSNSVLMMVDGRTMIVTVTVRECLDTYTSKELADTPLAWRLEG